MLDTMLGMPEDTKTAYKVGERVMYRDSELWYIGMATVVRERPNGEDIETGMIHSLNPEAFVTLRWEDGSIGVEDKWSLTKAKREGRA